MYQKIIGTKCIAVDESNQWAIQDEEDVGSVWRYLQLLEDDTSLTPDMSSGTWQHIQHLPDDESEWKDLPGVQVLRCATESREAKLISEMINLRTRVPTAPLKYIAKLEQRVTKAEKRASEADDFEQRAADAERERSRARQEERKQREAAEEANRTLQTSRAAGSFWLLDLDRKRTELAIERRALADERRSVAMARGETEALASLSAAELTVLQDQASQALLKIQAQLVATKDTEAEQVKLLSPPLTFSLLRSRSLLLTPFLSSSSLSCRQGRWPRQPRRRRRRRWSSSSLCARAPPPRCVQPARPSLRSWPARLRRRWTAFRRPSPRRNISRRHARSAWIGPLTSCLLLPTSYLSLPASYFLQVCLDRPKTLAFQCGHRVCATCGDAEAQLTQLLTQVYASSSSSSSPLLSSHLTLTPLRSPSLLSSLLFSAHAVPRVPSGHHAAPAALLNSRSSKSSGRAGRYLRVECSAMRDECVAWTMGQILGHRLGLACAAKTTRS